MRHRPDLNAGITKFTKTVWVPAFTEALKEGFVIKKKMQSCRSRFNRVVEVTGKWMECLYVIPALY